jgi:hypothetical protein
MGASLRTAQRWGSRDMIGDKYLNVIDAVMMHLGANQTPPEGVASTSRYQTFMAVFRKHAEEAAIKKGRIMEPLLAPLYNKLTEFDAFVMAALRSRGIPAARDLMTSLDSGVLDFYKKHQVVADVFIAEQLIKDVRYFEAHDFALNAYHSTKPGSALRELSAYYLTVSFIRRGMYQEARRINSTMESLQLSYYLNLCIGSVQRDVEEIQLSYADLIKTLSETQNLRDLGSADPLVNAFWDDDELKLARAVLFVKDLIPNYERRPSPIMYSEVPLVRAHFDLVDPEAP